MNEFEFTIVNDRLKKIMNVSDDKDVAKKLGIDSKNYSRYKRNNKLPLKEVFQFCLENNIIINSLLTGDHPLALKTISHLEIKNILDNEIAIPYYNDVQASCGDGCFAVEPKDKKYIVFDKEKHSLLNSTTEAINSFGDSMIPLVKEDSIVFIDRSKTDIIDSGIYLFIYEDMLYLKVLVREINSPDTIKAVPLNQIYPIMTINNLDSFRILGKFIYST